MYWRDCLPHCIFLPPLSIFLPPLSWIFPYFLSCVAALRGSCGFALLMPNGFHWFWSRFMLIYWLGFLHHPDDTLPEVFLSYFCYILYIKALVLPHVIFCFGITPLAFEFLYLFSHLEIFLSYLSHDWKCKTLYTVME